MKPSSVPRLPEFHALFVGRAVPAFKFLPGGLVPGDMVTISEGSVKPIALWRPATDLWLRPLPGQPVHDVCRAILLLLAQGALATALPQLALPARLALSQIEAQTAPKSVKRRRRPDVNAALARLAVGADLPREERGATLTWLATEREGGYGDNDGEWDE